MRCCIALTFAMLLVCTDVRAQQIPGIDRPSNEVETRLASMFHCTMRSGPDGASCRSNPDGVIVGLSRNSSRDIIDKADFSLLVAKRRGRPTPEELTTAGVVIEAVTYLAPSWPNAQDWLASAIAAADQQKACSYMKIDGVVVSVMPLQPADTPGSYADIYVTRNFDIYSLCEY